VREHQPVLLQEVLEHLCVVAGGDYVDATFGRGGHTGALLDRCAPDGRVLALDRDPDAVACGQAMAAAWGGRLTVMHSPFSRLAECVAQWQQGYGRERGTGVDGIMFDLGVSSPQLDQPERGFSFRHEGPLDMRMDPSAGAGGSPRAMDLLARMPEAELADLIWTLGEERYSRRIARLIVERRRTQPLTTTRELAELLERNVPRGAGRIHPATRTFQALRIAVNGELRELEQGLEQGLACLAPGGRIGVISFHSLEDRMVKQAFRDAPELEVVPRKPVVPAPDEVQDNPRARSARLRVAVRVPVAEQQETAAISRAPKGADALPAAWWTLPVRRNTR
jgi:16S rRNA (cytosine1402-N4)-methyltransferase